MNKDLDAIYTIKRWISTHPREVAHPREDEKLTVPLISRFVATHYSYEALIVAQARLNPLASRQDDIQDQIDAIAAKKTRTEAEAARLEDLKDTLALLSGLEAASESDIGKRLNRVDKIIRGGPLNAANLRSRIGGITAERLFTNQKVNDLVSKAETEQVDYRRAHPVNVFFGPMKTHYLGLENWSFLRTHPLVMSVFTRNALVLLGSSLLQLALLYAILRRQLRTRGI